MIQISELFWHLVQVIQDSEFYKTLEFRENINLFHYLQNTSNVVRFLVTSTLMLNLMFPFTFPCSQNSSFICSFTLYQQYFGNNLFPDIFSSVLASEQLKQLFNSAHPYPGKSINHPVDSHNTHIRLHILIFYIPQKSETVLL